ncbi:tryptophan synthase subunit alpha [Rhodocaloribacter litoris]|uniref:tryptophan synthase subunit alpha n=1 Tax=Rhodocaloribacter litoris TaxID=2558931 RepID=UPI00141EE36D|nr:tryptophan synthase subunit alpha [Rhodocaloribacter litoris]QXD15767.1 tryptophan synthase subunit alpha [Rhodocaloribacter litoris]GIV60268.1 MAG: tryptophan synthase alpha chain [Rhodothermaceae bacterium]
MSRLHDTFARLRERKEKALGLFLTSGFPEPDATLPILQALDEAGADFIELGMPFSDPLAEGLPIQRSSERALRHGITMEATLRTAAAFRAASETPLLLMGYANPVYRYGVRAFCRRAAGAGVDGLILPDLPPEERGLVATEAADAGLDLIHLIAPNTPDERIEAIDRITTGFVYAVSITGLTGTGLGAHDAVAAYLERARRHVTLNPLLVGFGIRTHEDAVRLTRHTDGFIVGSALITLAERLWDDPARTETERLDAVRAFVRSLKHGTPVPG